jgi:opacity protein-like surface antigen
MRLKLVVAGLLLFAALSAHPQVAPSATQGGIPIMVGAGASGFYTDWSGYEGGATLWIDWRLSRIPRVLDGLSIELQGRDLNYYRTGDNQKLRMDTVSGAALWHYQRFHRFQPYVKFDVGYGSIDFSNYYDPYYTHDTRTVYGPGGGLDVRLWRNVWWRGDYEYQAWPDFFDHKILDPQGFTVGALYDFGHMHSN